MVIKMMIITSMLSPRLTAKKRFKDAISLQAMLSSNVSTVFRNPDTQHNELVVERLNIKEVAEQVKKIT